MEEPTQLAADETQVTESGTAEAETGTTATETGTAAAPDETQAETAAATTEESIVEEVVDWVEHEAARAMFEANEGLSWIKTKMHDGVIRMLGRNGETQ